MVTVLDSAILPRSDTSRPALDEGLEISDRAAGLRDICASLAARNVAPDARDARVRWAFLVGDLTRLAQHAPPPPVFRSRRIGEPAPTSISLVGRQKAHEPWLTTLRAQVIGILARHAAIDAFLAPGDRPPVDDRSALEARLMLATADALLGHQLDWPGRRCWASAPLGPLLDPECAGRGVPALTHLHAHLAAQDERFTPIVPLWQRAGIFDDPASGHGTPTLPLPSPAKTAPLAIPGSPTTDPHAGGGTPSKYRAWAALFAVMICAVLAAQHMLWRGFVEGLATKLAAGG